MTTKHTPGPWAVSDVGEVTRLRAEAKRADEEIERLRAALDDVMGACDAECAGCGAYYVAKKAIDNTKEKP